MNERYQSTKTYGHEVGLSCCFRQHKAQSHCRFLHGYSLAFKFTFEADQLDERGWVQDFGALKPLKSLLENQFDHKLVVADDDPALSIFISNEALGLCQLRVERAVGVEAFAKIAFDYASGLLSRNALTRPPLLKQEDVFAVPASYPARNVRVVSCECSEHGANSAIYYGPSPT